MTMKLSKSQVPDKSQNSYKIKKNIFGAKNEIFKVKNRPVNKDQEVRGQISTTFSETPNSGLTDDENIFVVARLKLALFQFQCHFFTFIPPFLILGPFLGVTPNQ